MGKVTWNLWYDGPANPIATRVENLVEKNAPRLILQFQEYPQPIKFPEKFPEIRSSNVHRGKTTQITQMLDDIISKDPLQTLSPAEKQLIWEYRDDLKSRPEALVKFLSSVPWNDSQRVNEAHLCLDQWIPLEPLQAFELLDAKFADPYVRAYAVKCLEKL